MGLRDWAKGLREWARQGPDFGAMSFGGTGSLSSPNVTVSESLETALRLEGTIVNPDLVYKTQPAVYICVNFLGQNVGHTKLKTYRAMGDNEHTPAPDSELARLLKRPNPRMTGFDLIHALVCDWALWDDAYWLKARAGDARRLYRLPPAFVTAVGGDILTGPSGYNVNTGQTSPKTFSPEEIVHFHGYNSRDTRSGQSRLAPLRMVLREESEASKFRGKFWEKGAQFDGILKRPVDAPVWDDDQIKRFREGWRKYRNSGALAGETAVLEDGMDYGQASFSPKDAEFILGREWALDVVATAYHIPLSVLSRKQTSTFASAKEFRKALYVDTLGPINAMIESAVNLYLVPEFDDPDLFVEFNIAEKLQGDFESSADAWRSAVQVPWETVNGARLKNNEPPIGDPNDPDNPFNIPAMPANYSYGGTQEAPTPAPAPVATTNGHGGLGADDEMEDLVNALEAQ